MKVNNHLSCVPVFCHIPAFTLPVSELSACQVAPHFYVSSQVSGWVSKLQVLEIHVAWTHAEPLWVGLTALWLFGGLSQRLVALVSGLQFMVKCSRTPAPRLTAFSQHPCLYVSEWSSSVVPIRYFVHPSEMLCPLSQIYSKQGNCFSLRNLGDPQTILPTPRSLPSFPLEHC